MSPLNQAHSGRAADDARSAGEAKGSTRRMTLIVDGYNVLRSSSLYRGHEDDVAWDDDYSDAPINPPREHLIADVAAYATGSYTRAVIVFDGAGNEYSDGEIEHAAGIEVIYSPFATSADSVIEQIVYQTIEQGAEAVVVSSDATIQSTVFKGKVTRMSAEGFAREMHVVKSDIENRSEPARSHAKVSDGLDADTLEKLRALLGRAQ